MARRNDLKILILHNQYNQRGGEDVMVDREIALLRSNGHEVAVHFLNNKRLTSLWEKAKTGLNCVHSAESESLTRKLLLEHRPDVCHVHNFFPLWTPSVYDACRELGVPVVQTLHNYRLFCANGLFLREGQPCELCLHKSSIHAVIHACYRDSRAATVPVARMIFHHRRAHTWENKVDKFISLTNFAKKKFSDGGIPADLLDVKYNFCEDIGLGSRTGSYAVYLGRLSPEKGIASLVASWAPEFPDLYFVGQGEMADTVKFARKPNVSLMGNKTRDEAMKILADARFFVLPTECYEGGTPSALIEALCVGVPVLTSKIGGISEVLRDGENALLFEPGNASAVGEAVQRLLADPVLEKKLRIGARAAYETNFTPAQSYNKLVSLYESVIAKRPKR